jgi:hypothetical protein
MKTKKSLTIALLSAVTALVLFSPAALAATSTPLNLGIGGIITNAGSQIYSFSGGAASGEVLGNPLNTGASVNYHFDASVRGLTTSGSGHITIPASAYSGGHGAIVVSVQISAEAAAAVFPLDSSGNNCVTSCTSEIPLVFEGTATISNQGQSITAPVTVESPYWNPFGGPIFIATSDGSLYLVVTYNSASVVWMGVVQQGLIQGTYGTSVVTGNYQTTSTSYENLVTGTETDAGIMVFAGMSIPSLNVVGGFAGKTTIPSDNPVGTNGSFDCAPYLLLPEGTCTATGASSAGSFLLFGHGTVIKGSYSSTWSVPSLTTTTVASAAVTSS